MQKAELRVPDPGPGLGELPGLRRPFTCQVPSKGEGRKKEVEKWEGEKALTQHSAVEVVGEHALAHRNQQPEGILLGGVEQQHGSQDIHGLRARGGVTEWTTWTSDIKAHMCKCPTAQYQGAPHARQWDDCVSISVVSHHLSPLHSQPVFSVLAMVKPCGQSCNQSHHSQLAISVTAMVSPKVSPVVSPVADPLSWSPLWSPCGQPAISIPIVVSPQASPMVSPVAGLPSQSPP